MISFVRFPRPIEAASSLKKRYFFRVVCGIVSDMWPSFQIVCEAVCDCVHTFVCVCVCAPAHAFAQLCRILCNPRDSSPFLSMGFPRQEYWSWLLFPPLGGIFLTQGLNLCLLHLLPWQMGSLPAEPLEKPRLGSRVLEKEFLRNISSQLSEVKRRCSPSCFYYTAEGAITCVSYHLTDPPAPCLKIFVHFKSS